MGSLQVSSLFFIAMELNLLTTEYLGVLSVPCVRWLGFSSVGQVFHCGGNFLIVMGVILIVEVDPYIH
jgi:hypothetical protein